MKKNLLKNRNKRTYLTIIKQSLLLLIKYWFNFIIEKQNKKFFGLFKNKVIENVCYIKSKVKFLSHWKQMKLKKERKRFKSK